MMLTAILLATTMQVASAGEIYKCRSAGGVFEYRDHPCDGGSGEKIEAKDTSAGVGMDLATIRAQNAEFNARQAARQRALDQANAEAHAAGERRWQQERAYQDSLALEQAAQAGNSPYYYPSYPYISERPRKVRVEVVPARKRMPPPSVPAKKRPDMPARP